MTLNELKPGEFVRYKSTWAYTRCSGCVLRVVKELSLGSRYELTPIVCDNPRCIELVECYHTIDSSCCISENYDVLTPEQVMEVRLSK